MKRILGFCLAVLLILCGCGDRTIVPATTTIVTNHTTTTATYNHQTTVTDSTTQAATTAKTTPDKPAVPTTTCSHERTDVRNYVEPTCTNAGYTGDTFCKACFLTIASGSVIQPLGHRNTEVRNQKPATADEEGYTGDTYCHDCQTLTPGQVIPKSDPHAGQIQFTAPDGTVIYIDKDIEDITGHFMALNTQTAERRYPEVEKEIVRLCNIEREKEGLQPLEWFEDAYYFTKIRATESAELFSHTRPNGSQWVSVYHEAGIPTVVSGENLFETVGWSIEGYAQCAVEGWMNSPGHRANILRPEFTRIAVAIVENGAQLTAAQNFFGPT